MLDTCVSLVVGAGCHHRGWGTNWVRLLIIIAPTLFLTCHNTIWLDNHSFPGYQSPLSCWPCHLSFVICVAIFALADIEILGKGQHEIYDCQSLSKPLRGLLFTPLPLYYSDHIKKTHILTALWTYSWFWAAAKLMIRGGNQKVTNDNNRGSKERQITVMSYWCREWR